MREDRVEWQWADRVSRVLGILGWVAIGAGFVGEMVASSDKAGQNVLVWTLTVFFLLQITRLVIGAISQRRRRLALSLLATSVVLWALGSAILNGAGTPDLTHFPAPGELLFLASYVAMAIYLLVDAARNARVPIDTWLHATVICGGAVCLTGSLLLTPVGAAYGKDGLSLFLALLYPLIDIVLATLVIGQALLRLRDNLYTAVPLLGGFLLFTYADSHFVTDLASGVYHFSVISDAAWGSGFALIIGAACRPRSAAARVVPRRQGSAETLVAAGVAITVLALHTSAAGVGLYLTVPAVLTLLAAGGRLAYALREARGAAEALALALTDDLTRLPNRRALRADLDHALAMSAPLALMLLDLDGFKDVNDTLGHSAGDDVLKLMAHRLREALPPATLVARLGGDEFAVIVPGGDVLTAMETAHELLAVLREPVRVDGIEILPSASIGIAPRIAEQTASSELLRRADVAMYQAKHQRTGVALYEASDDDFSKTKLMLAEELRKALADGQFELWYQPQIEAVSQRLCGVEALLRWRHPARGVLSPADFLPAARRAGLMPAISTRVAELAISDIATFRERGVVVPVALNCAPPELLSGSFLPPLYDALVRANLPAGSLVIEVTEDSFIAEPERARQVIHEIREHGLQVAIDDYGTGFSSLAYLRDLAVDELKIDRTFIAAMLTDQRTRMIVASTVQMATALSMRTVAEGVEDPETATELAALGVDVLQGYHIAPPMGAQLLPSWAGYWDVQDRGTAVYTAVVAARLPERPARPMRSVRVLTGHRASNHFQSD